MANQSFGAKMAAIRKSKKAAPKVPAAGVAAPMAGKKASPKAFQKMAKKGK